MEQPNTITIDSTQYVRADSLPPAGDRHIVVADRGWIFVGNLEDLPNGNVRLTNVANVRRWDSNGFGGACAAPSDAGVELDDLGRDLILRATAELFRIPVPEDWAR